MQDIVNRWSLMIKSGRTRAYAPLYASVLTTLVYMLFGSLVITVFTTIGIFVICLVWSHIFLWFVLIPFSFLHTSNTFKQFLGIVAVTIGVPAMYYFFPDSQNRLMAQENVAQYFDWIKEQVVTGILLGATTSILAFEAPVKR